MKNANHRDRFKLFLNSKAFDKYLLKFFKWRREEKNMQNRKFIIKFSANIM